MRLLLAVLASLVAVPALAQSLTVSAAPIIEGAIEGYLRPGFHALAERTSVFDKAVATLCDTPSSTNFTAAQGAFKAAVLAYAGVEFARLGPLNVDDRAERLLLWPDPKGIALRQVQAALAAKDGSVLDPTTLAPKSVAMQGLVAAEYLLFGTGSDALTVAFGDGAFRCGYLTSVATIINGIASAMDEEWQDSSTAGTAADMRAPKPDGIYYRSTDEVVQKLTGALTFGNDTIRDQRLSPVIGAAEGVPRPKSALFWRSGLTMDMVAADFAGLRALFEAARLPDALKAAGDPSTLSSIRYEFDNAARAAALVGDPIDAAVGDPERFKQLRFLVFVTNSFDTLLAGNLPNALGLTNGFSLLDGD